MGWLGNQEVTVIFSDDEITHVYWDSTNILNMLRDSHIETIKKELYEDPLNSSRHTDALIKLWKGE